MRTEALIAVVLCSAVLACLSGTNVVQDDVQDWQAERVRMVDVQLRARDIRDERVLSAMQTVPRHLFIPESVRGGAYGDFPIPIGHGQTISQPYIVAFMTQSLNVGAEDRVLEIGTGSGYQAAILSVLAKEVFTIEIIEPLAQRAAETLRRRLHEHGIPDRHTVGHGDKR